MKPLLPLKTAILLAYVAVCTLMVLPIIEDEPAAGTVTLPHAFGD